MGPEANEDRPAHVRAGSSLVRFGERLVVVQDDTNVLAVLDPVEACVTPVLLPRGPGGLRQFDEGRGNKADKLDLEAAVVVEGSEGPLLLCLGSGSSPMRERIAVVRERGGALDVEMRDAAALYAHLRATPTFSGSELNLEGAVRVGDHVLLFQRGNGAEEGSRVAVDAVGIIDAGRLVAFLEGRSDAPKLEDVRTYDLGRVGSSRLTFTDATLFEGALYYSAAAEDSPDATRDGPVAGVALGRLADDGDASYALVVDEQGRVCTDKIEGICFDRADRLFAVVDRDDATAPAELLTLAVEQS